jgi:hypothetical protein
MRYGDSLPQIVMKLLLLSKFLHHLIIKTEKNPLFLSFLKKNAFLYVPLITDFAEIM